MIKYFHIFDTQSEFEDKREHNYYEPWVSYTINEKRCDYNENYLTP